MTQEDIVNIAKLRRRANKKYILRDWPASLVLFSILIYYHQNFMAPSVRVSFRINEMTRCCTVCTKHIEVI